MGSIIRYLIIFIILGIIIYIIIHLTIGLEGLKYLYLSYVKNEIVIGEPSDKFYLNHVVKELNLTRVYSNVLTCEDWIIIVPKEWEIYMWNSKSYRIGYWYKVYGDINYRTFGFTIDCSIKNICKSRYELWKCIDLDGRLEIDYYYDLPHPEKIIHIIPENKTIIFGSKRIQ